MRVQHRFERSGRIQPSWLVAVALVSSLAVLVATTPVQAAISWDGGGNSNWWFDPVNWSRENDEGGPFLPPSQGQPVSATDAQINAGTDAWDITGEGVVYDPENDPFFPNADNLAYPTGSTLATLPGYMRDYGPQTLYRLYISRNTTNTNLLTIKSGDLVIESTTIVGRSGSTVDDQNLGMVVQEGGSVRLPLTNLDMGNRETSGWGNGIYDYRGGILEVALEGAEGIRLSSGGSAGTGGHGRFIMRNPESSGHVRTWDFRVADHGGNGDGVLTGVGIAEFHYDNGGTRPIQVSNNLVLNNGLDDDGMGIRSPRLELVLDEAPMVDMSGVPINLGLFDVDFDNDGTGTVTGTGDADGNGTPNEDTDQVFSNADASALYAEGSMVSAVFGNTQYNWSISYTGNITWADADNSVLGSISGMGTGTDVVLMGVSSEMLAGLAGDYNENGVVDAADYTVWRDNFGGTSLANEGASTGVVDQADYDFWKQHFGESSAGGGGLGAAAAVPEPSGWMLVAGAMLLIGLVCTRHRGVPAYARAPVRR